jgi:hypothetical protein
MMQMILRCPDCRTRRTTRGLFTRHVQATGHKLCRCGGYHYAHRPGSPLCAYNPLSALRLADRDGADEDDLIRCARYIISETPTLAPKVQALLEDWKIDVQPIR